MRQEVMKNVFVVFHKTGEGMLHAALLNR